MKQEYVRPEKKTQGITTCGRPNKERRGSRCPTPTRTSNPLGQAQPDTNVEVGKKNVEEDQNGCSDIDIKRGGGWKCTL